MKVYKEYKEIEVKDIKGARVNLYNEGIINKINRAKEMIKNEGIKKPIEVVGIGNEYYVVADRIKFIAAKALGYDKIPCLIRDVEKEILLRRLCKKLGLKDENNKIKLNEKRLNSCRKNYYKSNIL